VYVSKQCHCFNEYVMAGFSRISDQKPCSADPRRMKYLCCVHLIWQHYVGHDATGRQVESRHLICSTVYQLLLVSHVNMSSYVRNKMAKLIVCVARQDWPHNYQDFFTNIYMVRECLLPDRIKPVFYYEFIYVLHLCCRLVK